MLRPGLVSITYRKLNPREIVDLCVQSQLEGIEWGGDIHVPHGDAQIAREVAKMTRDAGLEVACYGSYYRCDGEIEFARVVESAVELGAPLIRVWAGNAKSDAAEVLSHLEMACEMAGAHRIGIATEYHGGTLTQTREGCRQMLQSVGHPNLQTLWQPLRRGPSLNAKTGENLEDLRDIATRLANVHVYEWRDITAGQTKRASLQNSVQWPQYIEELQRIGGERWMLLEYVPDDAPHKLKVEAAALRALLQNP